MKSTPPLLLPPLLPLLLVLCVAFAGLQASDEPVFSLKKLIDDNEFRYPQNVLDSCGDDGKGKVPIVSEKSEKFDKCFQGVVDFQKIMVDYMAAYEEGTVQNVTKHHCYKVTPIYKCLTDFVSAIEKCFDDRQKDDLWMLVKVIRAVMDFVCYDDGNHVSIFLMDGGIDCVTEHQLELEECVWNNTDGESFNATATNDLDFMWRYSFDRRSCLNLLGMTDCLILKLKQCPNRTPSYLVKALKKDVFKETPCWQYITSGQSLHESRFFPVLFIVAVTLFL